MSQKIRSMRCQPSKANDAVPHECLDCARSHDLANDSALPSAVSFNPPLGYHIPISTSMRKEKTILGCRMEDGGMYWCGVSSRIVEPAPSSGDRRRIPCQPTFWWGGAVYTYSCPLHPNGKGESPASEPPASEQYPMGHTPRANGVNTWFFSGLGVGDGSSHLLICRGHMAPPPPLIKTLTLYEEIQVMGRYRVYKR
jgi:hypothetical protein